MLRQCHQLLLTRATSAVRAIHYVPRGSDAIGDSEQLRSGIADRRPATRKFRRRNFDPSGAFVDRVRLTVSAGNGGPGRVSFEKGPNKEIAPPDGGVGGNGGSIWVEASNNCSSLRMSTTLLRAEDGGAGGHDLRHGKYGKDVVVSVPVGTVVRTTADSDPLHTFAETNLLLCDLDDDGQRAIIAKGGLGGRGNASFKSSTNRSPLYAQPGTAGEQRIVELELKTIADVGLVAFPNAGKSTLLRAVSHARPKVAAYPFTTLRPHVGVVEEQGASTEEDARRITIADIPGLIAGAHENRGLGHEFLRHIERTLVLVYVLDVGGRPADEVTKEYRVLRDELEFYKPGLSRKPSCIIANKMDAGAAAVGNLDAIINYVGENVAVFPASAKYRTGVDDIVKYLFHLLER